MNAAETVGVIGELLSWLGGSIGVVFLAIALILRSRDRKRLPTPVSVVEDLDEQQVAIWTAAGRTYSRKLAEHERLADDHDSSMTGFVAPQHPEHLVLQQRSNAERLCTVLAIIMLATGAVGFIASTASLFW